MINQRIPLIAGNWKMFKTIAEAVSFVGAIGDQLKDVHDVDAAICAPYTALAALAPALKGKNVALGAQNVHFEESGAFTGEIAPSMLKEIGCEYAIIGHSERRAYFAETDETVNKKVQTALRFGLTPIICVGEDLAQREAGETFAWVERQTQAALESLSAGDVAELVIAYEPIWAIGTGKSSTAEDANEVIGVIRRAVAQKFSQEVADSIRIQYGGSVKPENIATFMAMPEIDGALVGGASLEPASYVALVKNAMPRA